VLSSAHGPVFADPLAIVCFAAIAALIAMLGARPAVADPDCTCRAQGRDFSFDRACASPRPRRAIATSAAWC